MSTAVLHRTPAEQRAAGVWDYISPSRLNLWLRCPLAFRLRYIDGIRSPPSPAMFVGKRVHDAYVQFAVMWSCPVVGLRGRRSRISSDSSST